MYQITLQAMRFHALIGVLAHERQLPQPLEIDLAVQVESTSGVLDYARLYETVASVVTAGPMDYLEDVADRVATGVFTLSGRIRGVRVAVRKPHVALAGPLQYAEVVVDRRADA